MTVEERYLEKIMNEEMELVGELHNPFHSSIYGDYKEGLYVVCDGDRLEELRDAINEGSVEVYHRRYWVLRDMEILNLTALKGFLKDYCRGSANDDTMELYSVDLHTPLLLKLLEAEG